MVKHFTEGGTGITNFEEHEKEIYLKALRKYRDKNLYISHDILLPCSGNIMCLHSRVYPKDLSKFWEIFYRVKKNETEENYIKFSPKGFQKTYDEGCSGVKKLLKTLVPNFEFEKPFPKLAKSADSGALYLRMSEKEFICIKQNSVCGFKLGEKGSTDHYEINWFDIKGIQEIK